MRNTIISGSPFSHQLRLHYSWLLVFLLIPTIIVTQYPETYPLWQRVFYGICSSLLFLLAISIREFGINALAASRGIRTAPVTLLPFGGVSQGSKEATLPDIELLLATAGLLFNLLIVAAFYALHSILIYFGNTTIDVLIQWLASIFFMLALFHFIPILPLDAGRLLRAILWKTSGAYYKITRFTSLGGQITGLLLASGGIYLLVTTQQWFNGILLLFIGWTLSAAARQSYRKAVMYEALDQIAARDAIAQNCSPISSQLSLSQLVKDCVLTRGQRYFIVAEDAKLQGVITIQRIRKTPKKHWGSTRIGSIMTPTTKIITVDAQQSAASVLNKMDETGINEIPVLEKDKVVGFIDRDRLVQLSSIRSKFKM